MNLAYSFGNEDCRTEHEALKIRPGDRVICVTASGDRPLHLLLADAAEVACVDTNPSQNHLLALKKAALKELTYEQYLGFLGFCPMDNRYEMWTRVEGSLSELSRAFWRRRLRMIEKGVLYQGSVEKWCKRVAFVLNILRKEKVKKLFGFRHLDEQREFLEKEWETKGLKKTLSWVLHPLIMRLFVRPVGFHHCLREEICPTDYIHNRVQEYLRRHLAKDSPLLSLALLGKVSNENLPPYLSRLGAALIRSRLDRISHEDTDLLSYLKKQPDNSIDVFSFSDVASYVNEEEFRKIAGEMLRTAKSGARFCFRHFMCKKEFPDEFQFSVRRDRYLEKKLEQEDRCFVYRFTAGTVIK